MKRSVVLGISFSTDTKLKYHSITNLAPTQGTGDKGGDDGMFHGFLVVPGQRGRRAGLGDKEQTGRIAPGPMLIVPSSTWSAPYMPKQIHCQASDFGLPRRSPCNTI